MTENTMKKICAVLSFRDSLFGLLFFKFLLAISTHEIRCL